jgi:hypothetical protein
MPVVTAMLPGWQQRGIVLSSQAGDLVTALPQSPTEDLRDRDEDTDGDEDGERNRFFTAINAAESSIRFVCLSTMRVFGLCGFLSRNFLLTILFIC